MKSDWQEAETETALKFPEVYMGLAQAQICTASEGHNMFTCNHMLNMLDIWHMHEVP